MAQDRLAAAARLLKVFIAPSIVSASFGTATSAAKALPVNFWQSRQWQTVAAGLLHRRRVAHRAAQAAALDLHSRLPGDQYCPFGSRPKACWPYIVPTASQFRLTWRATALTSRQARCTGLSRCSP